MVSPLPSERNILLYLKPYNFIWTDRFSSLHRNLLNSQRVTLRSPADQVTRSAGSLNFHLKEWRKARDTTPAQTSNSKNSWNTLTSQIMLKICCSGDFYPANYSKGLQHKKERKHRFLAATQHLHSSNQDLRTTKLPWTCMLKNIHTLTVSKLERRMCLQPLNHGLLINNYFNNS